MGKNILTFFIFLINFTIGFGQDMITKISGVVIQAKITKIREFDFYYKKYDNLYGRTFKLSNREVIMIKHKEGYIDMFQNGKKIELTKYSNKDSIYLVIKAEGDAFKNYKAYKPACMSTFLMSGLGTPLLGMIPAIKCTSTTPNDKNLNFPDKELIKDPNYKKAYVNKAMDMKHRKVWGCWTLGLFVNIGFSYAFLVTGGFGSF